MNINDIVDECENTITWCTNFSERHKAIEEVVDLCYDILPKLSSALNSIHNKDYPEKYWQIMMGAWLYEFSSMVYDRKKLLEGYRHSSKITGPAGINRIIPRNTYESLKLAEVEEFNAQLFNDIQSETLKMDPTKSLEYSQEFKFNTDVDFSTKNNVKIILFNFFMNKIRKKNNVVVSLTAIPLKYQWSACKRYAFI